MPLHGKHRKSDDESGKSSKDKEARRKASAKLGRQLKALQTKGKHSTRDAKKS